MSEWVNRIMKNGYSEKYHYEIHYYALHYDKMNSKYFLIMGMTL